MSERPGAPRTLVVDAGSSSIKTAVVEAGLEPQLLGEHPTPQPSAAGAGRHETDPEEIVALVDSVIDAAVRAHGEIRAVAFATQMHGVLLTDGSNTAVSPFLSWQDERATEETPAGSMLRRLGRAVAPEVIAISGIPLRVGIGAATLARWVEENDVPSAARVHTLGSFLLSRLGGPYSTHVTNAAPLGLVDVRTGRWSSELITAYGLDGLELPAIVAGYDAIGSVVRAGRTINLHPDLGDHQASVLGSGLEDGEFAVSLGTAGIGARIAIDTKAQVGVEVRPYLGGQYLHVRSRLPGGRLAAQFFDAFSAMAQVTGTEVARAAFWQELSRRPDGVWGQVVDDFLDQYVSAYRDAVGELFGRTTPRRLRLNGGMAQHISWFGEEFGSRLGLPTVAAPNGDLTVRGIARLLTHAEEI